MKFSEFARRRSSLVIGLVLGLVTFALYLPIVRDDFVYYDDQGYLLYNTHVNKGLSWPDIVWAFKSGEQANWHPLTWISHMVDCQFFGLNPAGHHFTNVLFQTVNTLLVFFLLKQMTGKIWPSAFVAAFFGWHPLHVESVAWASERKDVLSAFFWLLTMMAYVKYVKKPRVDFYLLALVLFACALMSKPMAVTLPFALLLLDFWPLNRLAPAGTSTSQNAGADIPVEKCRSSWPRGVFLVFEKLPFFALTAADCLVTYLVQNHGKAVLSISALPFSYRLANALWSYLRYVSNTFCPSGLAIIYPYKAHLPVALVGSSIVLLVVWSVLFLWWRKKFPYLLTGWFWFLGTLIPTIGLVQVGAQAMADRYMYIPSIGLFILIVWSANDLIHFHPSSRKSVLFIGTVALAACVAATSMQISYWRNTITLFAHAIEVTGDNPVAYYNLGAGYESDGDLASALALYEKSVELSPNYLPSQFGLGRLRLENGNYQEAESHFDSARQMAGWDAQSEFDLALALVKAGRSTEDLGRLRMLVQNDPNDPKNHFHLGFILQKATNTDEAILEFSNALQLQPDYSDARYGLADALITTGRTNEALAQYRAEVKLHSNDPEAHYNLGLALLDNHQFADAEKEFTVELQLSPAELRAHYRLAQALADEGKFTDAVTQYHETLRILPNFPDAKRELNALLAAHPGLK
jgi:tetratricopeptide (TPR) repeat protein